MDTRLRSGFFLRRLGSASDEGLSRLVRVDLAGSLLVGFVELFLGGGRFDADEFVEGDAGAFGGFNFIF